MKPIRTMTDSLTILRAKMNMPKQIALVAGAFDATSARIAEQVGYDAIWASSLAIATARGHVDDDRFTLTDVLESTTTMARVASIPVIADVGSGWVEDGDITTIVHSFEAAGATGICMEDTAYPRINSLYRQQQRALTPVDRFAEKISLATTARTNPNFMILARVESLVAGLGFNDTRHRATAYETAGADAIVIHSVSKNYEEVEQVARSWRGSVPLVLIPTRYPDLPIEKFRAMPQIGMLIYANQTLRASMTAMQKVLSQILRDGHAGGVEDWLATVDEVLELQSGFSLKSK